MVNTSVTLSARFGTGLLNADPCGYHAKHRPEHTACIDLTTDTRWNYRDLDVRVDCVAGFLTERLGGDARGERIAFLGRNCLDEVALFFGCQRAGAIFVPLNWRLTVQELRGLIADCTPKFVIHGEEFAQTASQAAADTAGTVVMPLDGADGFSRAVTDAAPLERIPEVAPDAPHTLLYTSGTTGRPKAAILTRSGGLFAGINFTFIGEVTTESLLMCDTPLFHVVGLYGVVRAGLTQGATIAITDRFIAERTVAHLADPAFGVTHYFAVPVICEVLMREPGFAEADFSHLKAIFTGGAPLPDHLLFAYLDRGITLVNGFGMTETGTAMHMPVDREMIRANPGCVGLCAPFMEAKVVDEEGQQCPDGQEGELWLRGPAVTPGYWKRPDATEAAFSGEWFRSGDIARREPSGHFRLMDRLKDMYITGGENVYPAEVEGVIASHPAVAGVAVVGMPDEKWGEKGVAYVERVADASLDEAQVRSLCQALARYKQPAEVVFVETLPRTASGKIQKAVLRKGTRAPAG